LNGSLLAKRSIADAMRQAKGNRNAENVEEERISDDGGIISAIYAY
jgi:hypothetical protein